MSQTTLAGAKLFTQKVELKEEDRKNLEEKVSLLFKDDLRAEIEVSRYSEDPSTFFASPCYRNSLGDIYYYLMDRKTCRECPKHLLDCPLPVKGYPTALLYQKEDDSLKGVRAPCALEKEKNAALDLVYPCDVAKSSLFYSLESFYQLLSRKENLTKIQGIVRALVNAKKNADKLKESEEPLTGSCFYSLHSQTMASDLLKAICFLYARKGIKSSYISTLKWIQAFSDRDLRTQEEAQFDLERISSIPALFLENFDQYPRYLSADFNKNVLVPLLEARNRKGKVTYLSSSVSLEPEKLLSPLLKGSGKEGKREEYASLFPLNVLVDFDLR